MDVRRGAFQAQGPLSVKRTSLVTSGARILQSPGQNGRPLWVSGVRVEGLRSKQEPKVTHTDESLEFGREIRHLEGTP